MAHAGRYFGLSSIVTGCGCVSERRTNNKISDNNQKIVLKLRVHSATIELVRKLASVRHGLQNYHAVISGCVI